MDIDEKKTRAVTWCQRCTSSRVQVVPDSVLAAGSLVECGVCHGPAYVTHFDPPPGASVTTADQLRADVDGAALTIMQRVVDPLLGQVPITLDRDAVREELRSEIAGLMFERVAEHAHHHHRVAKSRRAWINAATAHLDSEWSGTPDELRAEIAGLIGREQAALQAQANESAAHRWQPIDTAVVPVNVYEESPTILLYDPRLGAVTGRAQGRGPGELAWWPTGANIMSDSDDELHPTHWMPLPEGP